MPESGGVTVWNVHALRLGSVDRAARDNFLAPRDRSGTMRLDFTMWILQSDLGVVVVDTGFSAAAAVARGRVLDRRPGEAVRLLGIEPSEVGHVILTHLHYDHAGNIDDFPDATVVVQAAELTYATGHHMTQPSLSHFFDVEDVVGVVRRVHAGTAQLVDGDLELHPGVELHLLGGHTQGLQVVRVWTERGWIVLASDALHYYENLEERNPFPAILDLGQLLDGYERIEQLADAADGIVPGHDPLVFERYHEVGDLPPGVVALHRPPTS